MATTKNITMKQFNGTDYDTLNPTTTIGNVDGLQNTLNGKLSTSGGTMTGALTLNGNPSSTNQAANKGYVDGKVEPNFSTTEQSTGKKWIDSRTIYKKTYSATNLAPSGGHYTIGRLTGFREIVKIDGVMYYGGTYISVIPAISSDGYIGVSDEGETGAIPKWTTTIYYTKN